jgi:lipopolysaccharide assembly outer membrane protein LptD (OstA)
MTRVRAIVTLAVFILGICVSAKAQPESEMDILSGDGVFGPSGTVDLTNGVTIKYSGSNGIVVLSADSASANKKTGEVVADGNVRIQRDDQVWVGQHINYNYKTHQMVAEQFRMGKPPVFAAGRGLHGDQTNKVYYATNAFFTTDDVSNPAYRIRARHIKIIPGKRIEAYQAVLYAGDVPIFYFPYYSRNLGENANNFNFIPGYRSSYGAFILGSYIWYLNPELNANLHLDYRGKRGPGVGPDFNYNFGRWGEGTLKYYYTHDKDPETNSVLDAPVFENRQRVWFSYLANPFTNLEARALVRYQSDIGVIHDFYPGEYEQDPQPNTLIEVDKFWKNFSLNTLVEPRIDPFYDTVERLPDVQLSGFRQQLGPLPFYYESESSVGYYDRLFAQTNAPNPPGGLTSAPGFQASRADTFQQITMPETLFGWLNITPRIGARLTYYSQASGPGATTDEAFRQFFNTGAEVTFKVSRLWSGVHSKALELDGLRHIVAPSANYVYISQPNYTPNQLPQFDYQLPSLEIMPIEFPEYNSIDSINGQNVLRLGLQNKLQTKRKGQVQDFLSWQLFSDWRLQPAPGQTTFSDVYSTLTLRPRSWITFESMTQYNPNTNQLDLAFYNVTFQPNDVWSWSIGQYYLRSNTNAVTPTTAVGPGYNLPVGPGNNLITSRFFFRLNENWGFRATHSYNLLNDTLQQQYYTIYRDMRSWTAALTAGLLRNEGNPNDFTIAFTFSFKAMPRFGLGTDTAKQYSLLDQ